MGVFFYVTTRQCNSTGERNSEKDCPSPRRDREEHTQGEQLMNKSQELIQAFEGMITRRMSATGESRKEACAFILAYIQGREVK